MNTLLLALLPASLGLVLAVRTIRDPRGPFPLAGDTLLEDLFGREVARKVHLALAATCAAFCWLIAFSVFAAG